MIRVSLDRPKTPHPPVGTPRGGDVIEHPPAINPPSPSNAVTLSPRNAVTPEGNTVTPPSVTRYPLSKSALKQKAYRERKKAAGPIRIAVPCHPDHLGGLDVWGL